MLTGARLCIAHTVIKIDNNFERRSTAPLSVISTVDSSNPLQQVWSSGPVDDREEIRVHVGRAGDRLANLHEKRREGSSPALLRSGILNSAERWTPTYLTDGCLIEAWRRDMRSSLTVCWNTCRTSATESSRPSHSKLSTVRNIDSCSARTTKPNALATIQCPTLV